MANDQPLGRLTFLVFGLLFCWASVCFSAVPTTINYQGQLTDDLGDPLPDGTYDMWFYLFDSETGGNQLWNSPDGEQQTVIVNKGIYNVQLGAIEPLNSKFFGVVKSGWKWPFTIRTHPILKFYRRGSS